MKEYVLKKKNSKPKRVEIDNDVEEIFLDLTVPRLIPVYGIRKKGGTVTRHLVINDNGRLTLV